MNDQELREMIRESIARHIGGEPAVGGPPHAASSFRAHASHVVVPLLRSGDADGACLIEPTVRCNHCEFCLSYGH